MHLGCFWCFEFAYVWMVKTIAQLSESTKHSEFQHFGRFLYQPFGENTFPKKTHQPNTHIKTSACDLMSINFVSARSLARIHKRGLLLFSNRVTIILQLPRVWISSSLQWPGSYNHIYIYTVGEIHSATLWCSGALHMVRHKNTFGALKIKYYGQMFVWGAFFESLFSPRGWQKDSQQF